MVASILGFQLVSRDNPLANVKSVRAWLAGVPRNDPVTAVETIVQMLQGEAAKAEGSAARLDSIIELDRNVSPLVDMLRSQYRLVTISDDVRQRLLRACEGLAQAFIQAYGEYAKRIESGAASVRSQATSSGVYARMFHYIGVLTRLGLFRYEQWIPGRWRALHQSYLAARARFLALEPFILGTGSRPGDQASAEQEYVQILLLHRLNTGNLTLPQIDWASEWLREWVPPLRLVPPPDSGGAVPLAGSASSAGSGPPTNGYWLDLGGTDGLTDVRPLRAEGEVLFLDVEPLRAQIKALIGRLTSGAGGVTRNGVNEGDDALSLAKRVDRLWQPQAPVLARRGERRAANDAITVAAGWAEITAALGARHVKSSMAPSGYHYDDYGRLRHTAETKDRATGSTRRGAGGTAGGERFAWQVADSSESGYRIRSSTRQATRQTPGALLALQIEDASVWQLAIVRRLKRIGAELTELGVEVISRNISMVSPREIETRDSGYTVDGVDIELKGKSFQALYLPPQMQARVRSPASLVIPPAEYSLGRRLSVTVDVTSHTIVLASPLERTREWVWTPLRSG